MCPTGYGVGICAVSHCLDLRHMRLCGYPPYEISHTYPFLKYFDTVSGARVFRIVYLKVWHDTPGTISCPDSQCCLIRLPNRPLPIGSSLRACGNRDFSLISTLRQRVLFLTGGTRGNSIHHPSIWIHVKDKFGSVLESTWNQAEPKKSKERRGSRSFQMGECVPCNHHWCL